MSETIGRRTILAARKRVALALVIGCELVGIALVARAAWPISGPSLVVLCMLAATVVSFELGRYLGRRERRRVLEHELAASRSINRCLALANASAVEALRREARRRIGELADGREIH
jgi:glucose-6-phosphate-specific signal transduction histidine kinase